MSQFSPASSPWWNDVQNLLSELGVQTVLSSSESFVADADAREFWINTAEASRQRAEIFDSRLRAAKIPVPRTLLGAWQDLTALAGLVAASRSPDEALALAYKFAQWAKPEARLLGTTGSNKGAMEKTIGTVEALRQAIETRLNEKSLNGLPHSETVERSSVVPASRERLAHSLGRPGAILQTLSLPFQIETSETHLQNGLRYHVKWAMLPRAHPLQVQVVVWNPPYFWIERVEGPGLSHFEYHRTLDVETTGSTRLSDRICFAGEWGHWLTTGRPSLAHGILSAGLARYHQKLLDLTIL